MRHATPIPALLALSLLGTFVSCQVISGLNDYEFVDSTDAGAGNVGGSAGSAAAGGGTAGDGGISEAPCDSSEKPVSDAIFVSPNGAETNNGKPDFPVQTLTTALALAKANFATHIYLAEGDYTLGETLALGAAEGGIVMEGGWTKSGPNWSAACKLGRRAFTTLAVPSAIAVRVQDLGKPGSLRHLKISTKANAESVAGQPGESMFGVWVSGATSAFSLYDVELISGDAGNGGEAVTPGAPSGTVPCDGHNGCCTTEAGCGDTTVGPTPPDPPTSVGNDAATSGAFDSTGYVAANGDTGQSGSNGYKGKAGGAGENKGYVCLQPSGCCGWCSSGTCIGTTGCAPTGLLKAEDGKCGCGGLGGLGGMGGRGGGASVTLLVTDGATVTVEYSSLHAGNGGGGELGGSGGPAAPGGPGSNGAGTDCDTSCHSVCEPCASQTSANGGLAGTIGGFGAIGGSSGAGAGGPSYSYVAASATVSDNGNNSFTFGLGGKGANSAASGPAGVKP